MAKNTVSNVVPVDNEMDLNFIDDNGEILFTAEEIGRQLDYKQPRKSINILFNRNQKELEGYTRGIRLIPQGNQSYQTRLFTEEGVYILSMLANTPKARDFRAKLARLLRELRERRLELAREAGYAQGRDETLSLPSMQAERQAGYLAGLNEGNRLWQRSHSPRALLRMAELRRKGLTWREVGAVLGITANAARKRLASAVRRGMPTLLAQGV